MARGGLGGADKALKSAAVCDLELEEERKRRKSQRSNFACVYPLLDTVLFYLLPRYFATMCLYQLGVL